MVVPYNASFFDAFCFGKAKFPAFPNSLIQSIDIMILLKE